MGWSIDAIMWFEVRDKILGNKYMGCVYDPRYSDSPIIIRHLGTMTEETMREIAKLFPARIRIEFQEVVLVEEQSSVMGNFPVAKGIIPLCPKCFGELMFSGTVFMGSELSAFRCLKCDVIVTLEHSFGSASKWKAALGHTKPTEIQ